jgi:DNA-binding IscR family transcriptional regulator
MEGNRELPRGAIVGPQAAVLCAVLTGAHSSGEVARRSTLTRDQAYTALRHLRDDGLIDWEKGKRGTVHAL